MRRHESRDVLCPYYHGDKDQMIYCEGAENGMSCHQAFGNIKRFRDWRVKYCNRDWKTCPWAETMERRWEKELGVDLRGNK